MKKRYYILGGLVPLLIASQLIPNELPAVETSNPGDIMGSGLVSQDVSILLKKS